VKALTRSIPSIAFSLLFNLGFLLSLLFIQRALPSLAKELQLESIFTEEIPQEEITRELDLETAPAETLNVIAGGTPSSSVGASSQAAAAPVNVQKAAVMKEVNIRPVMSELALPTDSLIGEELGEGEIVGEVGSMVEGYGAAMGIITQEIVRMMRQEKVTVIWLFDESGSMVDDRKQIRENYIRVYEELGIASKQDKDLRKGGNDLLLTVVASYGRDIHEHTPRPTDDVELVKAAIDKVPIDQTGSENMCQSLAAIIAKYKKTAKSRKLAVIVVSDESGDDGDYVEAAVQEARAAKAPVYFLGRESMFGYPYARQRWVDEPTKEEFWIQIRRGPETPFPECLQWNGLHSRWDAQSSGFGPYEQVRMARETGGIFFVLPGDEETLVGQGANDKRKYDFLSMREYQPNLVSRQEYIKDRATSAFRETVWQVVARLNPNGDKLLFQQSDPELNIQSEHFPLELAAFATAAQGQVARASKAMNLTNEAIDLMEKVKPERAKEATQRWRAGYDLALAQLYIFRIRLFQYLLAMDKHANNMPAPQNPKANEWNFWWDKDSVVVPDEAQFERLKAAFGMKMTREEYLEMVKTEETAAIERLKAILTEHPGTPWARRAETEINWGFGFRVGDRHWDVSGRRAEAAKRLPNL
jgi:hypothetical protein